MSYGLASGEAVFVSLKRRKVRGLFITFEGIEHCGKTTQCELLADTLRTDGHEVVLTREPGGTPLGAAIRDIVLHSGAPLETVSELLLFAADRAQHIGSVIEPALSAGKIVICDRFADSTRAYQGYGRGIDSALIDRAIALATGGLSPDLTILMDIDVETSRSRGDDASDRIEQDSDDFFHRVREGFLKIAAQNSARTVVLDGTQSIEDVSDLIRKEVRHRLADRV